MLKTYTGRIFDFENITKENIYIPDVLHALPSLNRFLGHSSRPYSVGEHTLRGYLMCADLGFTPEQAMYWFIHDFTEAYVGDCPTPLKKLLPNFKDYEAQVEKAILEHLGIEPPTEEEYALVKRIDATMLVLEMRDLTLHDYENFINEDVYLDVLEDVRHKIHDVIYDTEDIEDSLIETFNNLMKLVKGDSFECLEI